MRDLALEEKIFIFKTISISDIAFQSFLTAVQKHIVSKVEKTLKDFSWKISTPKRKLETLYNEYEVGGLKIVDIPNKIITLQCRWIKRLYDNRLNE